MKEKILEIIGFLGVSAAVALAASISSLPLTLPVALMFGSVDLLLTNICFFAVVSFGLLFVCLLVREVF